MNHRRKVWILTASALCATLASAGCSDLTIGPKVETRYVIVEAGRPGVVLENATVRFRQLADDGCCLVVTTGGTGPAPRDVTPEATEKVCTKILPGFGELMRQVSLKHVPTAILSRQTAGVCGGALVVNLPGRPKSIRECLDAVFPAIPYCVDLIHTGNPAAPRLETQPERLVAFRPK